MAEIDILVSHIQKTNVLALGFGHSKTDIDWVSSVAFPAIIIASANAYTLYTEHEEHLKHGPPLEDRVEYAYMNIRTKNFPWGDGDKVSCCAVTLNAEC